MIKELNRGSDHNKLLWSGLYRPIFSTALLTLTTLAWCIWAGAADAQTTKSSTAQSAGGGAVANEGSVGGGGGDPGVDTSDIVPPKALLTTPGGINVSDGSFNYSIRDVSIGTLSLDRFTRTGTPADYGFLGLHWSTNLDIYVSVPERKAQQSPNIPARYTPIVHLGASASGIYEQPISDRNTVVPYNTDAFSGALTFSNGAFNYVDSDGVVYAFNGSVRAYGPSASLNLSQRIGSITYPDGRVVTFQYDSSGRPHLVSDTAGYAIVMDYNDGSGYMTAACAFDTARTYISNATTCAGAPLAVVYSRGNASFPSAITAVVDTTGNQSSYQEDQYGVTCVQPAGMTTCKYANSYQAGVAAGSAYAYKQILADGSVWQVSASAGDADDLSFPPYDGDNAGSITDPNGKPSNFVFTKSSPYSVSDPLGRTTNYRYVGGTTQDYFSTPYHEGTLLVEVDYPEGGKYLAQYSGPFNKVTQQTIRPKPGSNAPDLVEQYGYDSTGNATLQALGKPIWKKDRNGNETDYTYASWGGMLTELDPAPSSGAARPLKLYSYAAKTAYVLNASGSMTPAGGPIWKLSTETECQTAAGSSSLVCDSSAPQIVTTYQYGADGTADNLLVRGVAVASGGQTRLTCYSYDQYSNKISETKPRGGLTTCP